MWEEARGAPPRKSDILAGTEFLSVFINGAMAPTPQRRRGGFRRGGHDSATAESHQHEASIYRISRNPNARSMVSRPPNSREEVVRFYPISQRTLDNRQQNLASLIDDLSTPGGIRSTTTTTADRTNGTNGPAVSRQKVIGVSVTSTVEATPYKVRVEHYDSAVVTRPPTLDSPANREATRDPSNREPTTTPAQFVTEELSNIVSESNRSEFSVDEESPRTSWRATTTPQIQRSSEELNEATRTVEDVATEENYEKNDDRSQNRKAGRHYDAPIYNRSKVYGQSSKAYKTTYNEPAKVYSEPAKVYGEPERVYGEPAKVYSEPARVYSEPARVYSEPAKVYSEPAKIYGEPEKVYSEPSKIYSEPAKVYSEPAKIYSQPAKVYGEPSKVYERQGGEPDERNYEVDESASVGSNGNVHGPQLVVTEIPAEDGHKVGYVVEGRNFRKYRVEERTPDGFIVGEYGVVSHDDGSLRGVRYTADGTIDPQLIYDALKKFLSL